MAIETERWAARLAELADEHGLPGASLAVVADGELVTTATGVVNAETGVAATPAAVFQIGSITKVYVATVVAILAERGALDLDRPLRTWMPELRLADERVAAAVTPRHLLTHTSGIAGDFFPDTGRGEDALERLVERCADLGQDVPLGTAMSYSNTGYSLLGRLVERVTGKVWDTAMQELLYRPAGLVSTLTLPEEALRHRTAFGHEQTPDGPLLVDAWDLPRAAGPAGGICATAAELAAFGRIQLDGGRAADGMALLSGAAAAEMVAPQVAVPDRWTLADHWGLGWMLRDVDGRRVIGHSGNGAGQNAFLTVVPDAGVVLALLTNGGDETAVGRLLFDELLAELCDLTLPGAPAPLPAGGPIGDSSLAGSYERYGVRIEIAEDACETHATMRVVGPLAEQLPGQEPVRFQLLRSTAGADAYVARPQGGGDADAVPLVPFEVGGERYVHVGGRAMRAVGGAG